MLTIVLKKKQVSRNFIMFVSYMDQQLPTGSLESLVLYTLSFHLHPLRFCLQGAIDIIYNKTTNGGWQQLGS